MQWANASAVEGVKFTLLGDVVADPWRPGGQMGAGQRGTLQWRAEFVSLPGGAVLKESLELTSGESVAGLLVGDFVENKMPASSGQLAPGFSKIGPGKSLRAALLRFPVDRERKSQHPVYLVNADPEKRVKVVVDRTDYDLDYAIPQRLMAPVGERVTIKVSAVGLNKEMSFTLEPSQRGGILAFYRTGDVGETSFVFVNLRSIESIKEMVEAQAAADTAQ